MSFLQPFILWALPLMAIPVLVHLLNRMRYRTMPWAAMMFLRMATRQSTRQAKLREWLILACRVLAVAALIFAIARPLVGGWLGWAMGAAPDTIVLLLDRSASMDVQDPTTHLSKRVLALRRLTEAGNEYVGSSRFVLIESALRKPQEVASLGALETLSTTAPTDSAADIPALLDAALDYVVANQCGRTEIWLASDLQQSNWQPESRRWEAVRTRFASLPQDVRVRLLALTEVVPDNVAVAVRDVQRRKTARGYELAMTVELTRNNTGTSTLPLAVVHEGARSLVNVQLDGQRQSVQVALDLGQRKTEGWGWIELPADANTRDNTAYFSYPEDLHLKTAVVAESDVARRVLRVASAPAPAALNESADTVAVGSALKLDDVAMLVWQGASPSGTVANVVRDFAGSGGTVIVFPGSKSEDGKFRVTTWRRTDGPLANAKDGRILSLGEVAVTRREALNAPGTVLASFADGKPFLVKQPVGKGAMYWCATLPVREWSSLDDGTVLVPMLQRILQEGGRRLSKADNAEVGAVVGQAPRLSGQGGRAATDAGVYQVGTRVTAVNRPVAEDEPDVIDEAAVRTAFGPVSFRMFTDKGGGANAALQSEIWRWFMVAMLLLLTGEAVLALPKRAKERSWAN